MPRQLGPYDKRRQRIRCNTCISLHIKCNGKVPCHNCQLSQQVCVLASVAPLTIRLGNAIATHSSQFAVKPVNLSMTASRTETCISHVLDRFLRKNDFTARPSGDQQNLKSCIQVSASTRNAVIALGALDLTRNNGCYYKPMAVAHYRQSISSLRSQLASASHIDDSALWTSLLLALFELMSETSGTGFMLHFTRGLPALLRNQKIDRDRAQRCRLLLHSVQMLEVMRAASFWTYTDPAMLEDPNWQVLMEDIAGDTLEAAQFSVLYALMGRLLRLNNLVAPIVLVMTCEGLQLTHKQQLRNAALEGWNLREELDTWRAQYLKNSNASTPISIISNIYHTTLNIDLISIFNFPHFERLNIIAPATPKNVLEIRVDVLILLLETALRSTALAGLLLLWPIRVAGAKATRHDQVSIVLGLLREVEQRGFAVAKSFEEVLTRQWKLKKLL